MTTPIRRPLGALPSPVDHRDYRIQALPTEQAAALPAVYRIDALPLVRDQGNEGTCVAHALVGILDRAESAAGWPRHLSVRDAYANARTVEPVAGEGCYPRAALKAAQQMGVCLEEDWPYQPQAPGLPKPAAQADRPLNRVGAYAAVTTAERFIKEALVHQGLVLVVVPVSDGFWTPDAQGRVSYRGPVGGYHAVVLCGYDESRQAFRLRNSWGSSWGEGGYCWLPFGHPITEAWTLTAVITAPPNPRPWWMFW